MVQESKKSPRKRVAAAAKASPVHEETHGQDHGHQHGHDRELHEQGQGHEHGHEHEHEHHHPHEHGDGHDHEHGHDHGHTHGPKPLTIAKDRLTAEAKAKSEEETGKPVEDLPYKVTGEEAKPGSVTSLGFELDAEVFAKELDRYYGTLRKEVTLPGFRKGKAPVRLIRIRMGEDGDRDAMTEVAVNVLRQEVLKRELPILSDARIVTWSVEQGKPLTFTTEVETQPKVQLTEYKGLSVKVEKREITEANVDEQIERLQRKFATEESAPAGGKVAKGDSIVIDLKVLGANGKELLHLGRKDHRLRDFARELPEELAAKIEGLKVGETASAEIKENRTNRRGEELEFRDTYEATIKEIKVTKLPKLDDEFAKDVGEHETLADLRASIRKDIEEHETEQLKNSSVAAILEAILAKNPVDPPHSLVDSAQYQSMMRDSMQLRRMGLSIGDIINDPAGYFSQTRAGAEQRIKSSLLCGELAKKEDLSVSEDDLEKEIQQIAERAGRKPLAIRANLEAEGRLEALREELLNRKLSDFLLANNSVEYIAAKPKPAEEA